MERAASHKKGERLFGFIFYNFIDHDEAAEDRLY